MVEEQIQSLKAKIAEKLGSKDKLDLWLVEHWESEIKKLKYETILTKDATRLDANR